MPPGNMRFMNFKASQSSVREAVGSVVSHGFNSFMYRSAYASGKAYTNYVLDGIMPQMFRRDKKGLYPCLLQLLGMDQTAYTSVLTTLVLEEVGWADVWC